MARGRRASTRKRIRDRNFVAIPFSHSRVLPSTANDAGDSQAILTFGEDIFIMSADVSLVVNGTVGEGPLIIGLHHGDLSITEVIENLDADLTDPDDIIQKERARRPVRMLGMLPMVNAEQALGLPGERRRLKFRFTIGDGHSLNLFTINKSGATISSSPVIDLEGLLYGRWRR